MKAIFCQQVKKYYADKCILNDINLAVSQGEFFGLIGMNGSGKSTLIKCILDLTAIDAGKIELSGCSHRNVSARRAIAYLPESFSLPAYLRSSDFLFYLLRLHSVPRDDVAVKAMLESLGMNSNVLSLPVSKLSKGMLQKIGLAVCLLSNKKLLILDEPMSGLDPKARVLLKRQLQQLKKTGVSIFFSSHVLADVDELADNMAVLHNGRILFTGTTESFKDDHQSENLEQAYMCCIGG